MALGCILLLLRSTRLLGRRLLFGTALTVPGVMVASVVGGLFAIVLFGALGSVLRPWTDNGNVDNSFVAAAYAFGLLAICGLVTGVVGLGLLAGWAIGSRLAVKGASWETLDTDPIVRLLTFAPATEARATPGSGDADGRGGITTGCS